MSSRLFYGKLKTALIRTGSLLSALIIAFLALTQPTGVWAYSDTLGNPSSKDDIHGYVTGTSWYDPTASACGTTGSQPVGSKASQDTNARAVIGIAKSLNVEQQQQAALIGLMTALTESTLQNYANDGSYVDEDENYSGTRLKEISESLPHDDVGNDHDSVGIMQQRVTGGWAQLGGGYDNLNNPEVIKRLMTPAFAAEAFFKALTAIPNWQTMDPGQAAQTVQVSAPNLYNTNRSQAQSLLDRLWDSSPPLALSISLDASPASNSLENRCIGGGSSAILSKIREYAWPVYCKEFYCPEYKSGATPGRPAYSTTGKPVYIEAVIAAIKRDEYVGDLCGYNREAIRRGTISPTEIGADCGGFVTRVMRDSGADPDYNKSLGNTTWQIDYLRNNSGPGGKYARVMNKTDLQPGDIAIRADGDPFPDHGGHTFFFVGTAISAIDPNWVGGQGASASQCERAPMASGVDTFELYEWYHLN